MARLLSPLASLQFPGGESLAGSPEALQGSQPVLEEVPGGAVLGPAETLQPADQRVDVLVVSAGGDTSIRALVQGGVGGDLIKQ